jgi:hypothetical protein
MGPISGSVVVVVGGVVVGVVVGVELVLAGVVVVGVDGQPTEIGPTVTPRRVLQPTVTLATLPPPLVGRTSALTVLPVWVTVATEGTSTTVLDCC